MAADTAAADLAADSAADWAVAGMAVSPTRTQRRRAARLRQHSSASPRPEAANALLADLHWQLIGQFKVLPQATPVLLRREAQAFVPGSFAPGSADATSCPCTPLPRCRHACSFGAWSTAPCTRVCRRAMGHEGLHDCFAHLEPDLHIDDQTCLMRRQVQDAEPCTDLQQTSLATKSAIDGRVDGLPSYLMLESANDGRVDGLPSQGMLKSANDGRVDGLPSQGADADFNRGVLWRPVLAVTVAPHLMQRSLSLAQPADLADPSTCHATAVAAEADSAALPAGRGARTAVRSDLARDHVADAAAAFAGACPGSYGCSAVITWHCDGSDDGQVSGTFHVQRSNFLFLGKRRLQRPDTQVTLKLQTASPVLQGASVRLHFAHAVSCRITLQGVHEAEKLRDVCAAVHEQSDRGKVASDAAAHAVAGLAGQAATTEAAAARAAADKAAFAEAAQGDAAKATIAEAAAADATATRVAAAETVATRTVAAQTVATEAAVTGAAAAEAIAANDASALAAKVAAVPAVISADEPNSAIDGRVDGLPWHDAVIPKSANDGRVDGLPSSASETRDRHAAGCKAADAATAAAAAAGLPVHADKVAAASAASAGPDATCAATTAADAAATALLAATATFMRRCRQATEQRY